MSRVITRRQAIKRGVTLAQQRHRLGRGDWQRIFDGVFATHAGQVTYRERLLAATLARGPGAVVTLECALNLWGLTDREPPIITLAEPASTHRVRELPGVRVSRRRRLTTARRHGIPVTSLAQTLIDLAATMPIDDLIALVSRAVATHKVTVAALREELGRHPLHPRRTLLAEVLAAAEDGLESVAEVRYVRDVEDAHGLPRMERQVPLDAEAVRDGRSRRLDFRDRKRGLGVEIDGELWHRDRQAADRAKDRAVAGRGETMLRAGWYEVLQSPCAVAADVAVAQIARGWTGRPKRCSPECRILEDPRLRGLTRS